MYQPTTEAGRSVVVRKGFTPRTRLSRLLFQFSSLKPLRLSVITVDRFSKYFTHASCTRRRSRKVCEGAVGLGE